MCALILKYRKWLIEGFIIGVAVGAGAAIAALYFA
jgi:hypothetical protein